MQHRHPISFAIRREISFAIRVPNFFPPKKALHVGRYFSPRLSRCVLPSIYLTDEYSCSRYYSEIFSTASIEDLKAFGDRLDDELEHMEFTRDNGDIGAKVIFGSRRSATRRLTPPRPPPRRPPPTAPSRSRPSSSARPRPAPAAPCSLRCSTAAASKRVPVNPPTALASSTPRSSSAARRSSASRRRLAASRARSSRSTAPGPVHLRRPHALPDTRDSRADGALQASRAH